ncbi:MAG: undecaprenyl-diphosphate phosphatase [Christensenellaceae bacterium]|jgi:undecaprenyl-diphosphatase|nr:undecaprenyl-diphosphate phosphatase [Christensenellaceae bacterium]
MVIFIILGIIQGLTEFLPISSSGHLVLFENIFGVEGDLIFLNVVLHLGTFFAVCLYYRKALWEYIKKPFQKEVGYLAVATVPAVVMVLLLRSLVEQSFGGAYLAFGFLVSAAMLTVASIVMRGSERKIKPFNIKTAIVMGIFQAFAIFPGISRSGSTICGGILFGADKEKAANFSFIMSIPIILASLVFECFKLSPNSFEAGILPMLPGFIFAFVFGLLAISVMLKVVKRANFWCFVAYLVVLGVGLTVWQMIA